MSNNGEVVSFGVSIRLVIVNVYHCHFFIFQIDEVVKHHNFEPEAGHSFGQIQKNQFSIIFIFETCFLNLIKIINQIIFSNLK